jgi:hypothetical protein
LQQDAAVRASTRPAQPVAARGVSKRLFVGLFVVNRCPWGNKG